jgi:serine/threonine-protein kinase
VLHRELAQSPEMVERFMREVRAATLIRHPSIVEIWVVGRLHDGRPYFVMELLEGASLSELLRRGGSLSPREALEILEPIGEAVAAAHAAHIVHRDIKASNIFVSGSGPTRSFKLLDFGIAKLTQLDGQATALTAMGRKLGTPASMSPEQIRGRGVGPATDIYALGVLLFQILTCRLPFEATEPLDMERMHLVQPPPRPSHYVAVEPAVDAVVLRCLEKEPAGRFESVPAFLDALRAATGSSAPRAEAPSESLAIAVMVEAVVESELDGADADVVEDDAALDDLVNTLEGARQALSDAGLILALETGSALVGVSPLPSDRAAEKAERARMVELASTLHQSLQARPGRHPAVSINLCVHVDRAEISGADAAVSGAILSIGRWMPSGPGGGLYVTTDAATDLDLDVELRTESHLKVTAV